MQVVCKRVYGQPKLKKPKSLNNKTLLGSVTWNDGFAHTQCKVWLVDNIVYVLHRDWFSKQMSRQEAFKSGIAKTFNGRFIYNDNFGIAILRNEAILSFEKPDMNIHILKNRFNLLNEFAQMLGKEYYDLRNMCRWEDFFEDILKLLQKKGDD